MNPCKFILAIVLALPISCILADEAGDRDSSLKIRVSGLKSNSGSVQLRLFDSPRGYRDKTPVKSARLPISEGTAVWTAENLAPGSYGAFIFHDENDNERMDTNVLGIPKETVGASNNARGRMGPPTFEQIRFEVEPGESFQEILLSRAMKRKKWGVGVGAIYKTSPYRGQDAQLFVIPSIAYIGDRLALTGPRAEFSLYRGESFSAGLLARLRFPEYESDDSSYLEGLDDRDYTVMAGMVFDYRVTPTTLMELELSTDALNIHHGQFAELRGGRNFKLKRFSLTPGAGIKLLSADLADYLYGVEEGDARPDRPAYQPGATFNLTAGLRGAYAWSDSVSIMLTGQVEWLNDQIQDSPLVIRDFVFRSFMVLNYQF